VELQFLKRVAEARARLPKPQIGKHGQLMEWLEDYDEPEPGHRHISHLFALHPGDAITLRGTPELARAARTTLERRLAAGGGQTGWSQAWVINFWARLEEGEKARQAVVTLLRRSTGPNLFDTHPLERATFFQIDGNFGGLPESPRCCAKPRRGGDPAAGAAVRLGYGEVRGLRVRGAMEVELKWAHGKAKEVVLRPKMDGRFTLRAPKGQRFLSGHSETLPLAAKAGGEHRLAFE